METKIDKLINQIDPASEQCIICKNWSTDIIKTTLKDTATGKFKDYPICVKCDKETNRMQELNDFFNKHAKRV